MLSEENQKNNDQMSSINDDIIDFDQYDNDEEQIQDDKVPQNNQSIDNCPPQQNLKILLNEGINNTDAIQFKEDDNDNVAHLGSAHQVEEISSWKEENQNEQQEVQLHQIAAMTARNIPQHPFVQIYQPDYIADMREFLEKPIDERHIIQCTLIKDCSGTNRFHPKFSLYLSDCNRFLCAAKRQPFNQQIHYIISLLSDKFDRKHQSCLGKVKGMKGLFKLFDPGDNPNQTKFLDLVRKELCLVNFQKSLFQNGLVRQSIIIPRVVDGKCHEFKPLNDMDGLMKAFQSLEFKDKITHLVNKTAIYNKNKNKYQLDFNERVTQPSDKNCIIVDINNKDKSKFALQFGKASKRTYQADICHPLSIVQGLSICIAQFDGKA